MPPQHADEQEDARFRLAMAAAGIGMAEVAPDGRVRDANQALARMLGRAREELLGGAIADLVHPGDRALAARLSPSPGSAQSPSVEVELRCLHRDGRAVEVLVDAAALRDASGRPLYAILQFRDVGAQRAAERALRELEAAVEARVRERTAELEAAHRRMEALAAGVSHDLRAPLRAIDGFAAQLARQPGALDAQGLEYLARIRGASARMGELIDSLLELVRTGRVPLQPTRVDVSLLAEWALAELADAQPQRPASVNVQPGLEVVGDERLLRALLTQLLRNAWRFSAERERVEIAVEGMRGADGLQLVVRDRGIGFDMAHADKLFEPFQRLHGSEQGAGHGIGLAIARQAAVRHGGSIRAEAAPGAGATFHVDLPDLQAESVGPAAAQAQPA